MFAVKSIVINIRTNFLLFILKWVTTCLLSNIGPKMQQNKGGNSLPTAQQNNNNYGSDGVTI